MEDILQKCCKADNEAIQQGTRELKDALKKPEAIAALCNVVVTAQEVQIRQYAAVVLGRRMAKYRHWAKISPDDRNVIKQGILQALVNEPHKPVKNSIAYLIGVIMKHEASKTGWPELGQALFQLTSSDDAAQKEMGMYLLSILVDMNPKLFVAQATTLCALISSVLKTVTDRQSVTPVVFYAIDILKSLALGTENVQEVVNTAYEAVPIVVTAIFALCGREEERAIKFIQFLDNLSDGVPLVFDPHLKVVVEMCLTIAKEEVLGDPVRMKAMAFLGLLVTKKKKAFIKHNLVQPILDTLFLIVSSDPPERSEFDDEEDTPSTVANQTLDSLALNLPPGKVVIPMLKHIEAGMESLKPYHRKASCLAMAVMAEGCAEYIRTKHLEQFVRYVLKGVQDQYASVRNAALFALGQFSEHLQPDISKYSDEVMPVLLSYLDNLCQIMSTNEDPKKHPAHITRMFYALEMFCENLNERLIPFLPDVVDRLLSIFVSPVSLKVRELAISALNSAASAAKEEMAPHVQKVLEGLHRFLTEPQPPEFLGLQIHSVDTLAVLARSLGKENFRPLVSQSLRIAMDLVTKIDDPDLRRTTYGLFGALSGILGKEMESVLQPIVVLMLGALASEEGNTILDIEEKDQNEFAVYDDVSDENDEEDIEDESERSEDLDGCQVHIEDSFTEEKEEACTALGELAKNTGPAFVPYFSKSFALLSAMVGHPGIQVRCSALDAFADLTVALSDAGPDLHQEEVGALIYIVPKCVEIIQTEFERDVVASALDALDRILRKLKDAVLQPEGHQKAIVNTILLVLTGKTQCQEQDEDVTDDDDESEQDEILFEYAGNLIPALGKAMAHEEFLALFEKVLPLLLSKTREHSSVAQRSFVLGTLAETMEVLGADAATYFGQLLPIFLNFAARDENHEVRNNSIFALGELILNAKETALPSYPQILEYLSHAIATEVVAGNLDNICGAVARVLIVNPNMEATESVLTSLVNHLPLREDFDESQTIFRCLNLLYELRHPAITKLIHNITQIAITAVYKEQYKKQETLDLIVHLLKSIKQDFGEVFQATTSSLTEQQLQVLQERVS